MYPHFFAVKFCSFYHQEVKSVHPSSTAPWIWAGFEACTGQYNAEEVMMC